MPGYKPSQNMKTRSRPCQRKGSQTSLNLITNQKDVMLLAKRMYPGQVIVVWDHNPGFSLNWLNQERAYFLSNCIKYFL